MRKVILVEGKQDADFVKVLAPDIETREIEIKELSGAGKDNSKSLRIALDRVRNDALLKPIEKIGILLDLDPADFSLESKLNFLNTALEEVFGIRINNINEFQLIPQLEASIACYFINPNLDVLLRQIAAKPSPRANCLHACLENQENVKQKEKEKAWPLYYMRWDICEVKERENGVKCVNFTYTYSRGAWNLEAPVLADLKSFLALF